MSFHFRPARSFVDRRGCFLALTGGTNSGKTYSALRLARGIAGPTGKIAVLDTEGGRTLNLKKHFDFDIDIMEPPFRPQRFGQAAEEAEAAGYDAMLIDSFTMEWRGLGGVLDWEETELKRLAGDDFKKRDRLKQMSRIPGRMAHKAMVFSFLQRKMPIIFSIRGEETIKQAEEGGKPEKIFKAQCSPSFPFEMTIAFRLAQDRKGIIDLSDAQSWKMEEAHQAVFHDGDLISEEHGEKLAAWARGEGDEPTSTDKATLVANALTERIRLAPDQAVLEAITGDDKVVKQRAWLAEHRPELAERVTAAIEAALARFAPKAGMET